MIVAFVRLSKCALVQLDKQTAQIENNLQISHNYTFLKRYFTEILGSIPMSVNISTY